jgi:GAF domain-containing protein
MTSQSDSGSVSRPDREVVDTLVALADTLVADYDVADFMHMLTARSVRLLSVDAAGLLLSDQRGRLQVVALSNHGSDVQDLFEAQRAEGPSWECFNTGSPVVLETLEPRPDDPWPSISARMRAQGYRSVYAIPLRLRDEVIGALNLLRSGPGVLVPGELSLARGLADIATIGLLQERTIREQHVLAEQLQSALTTRVVIEQVKGVLAERGGLDMDAAFAVLRSYARRHQFRLADVAQQVIDGAIPAQRIIDGR